MPISVVCPSCNQRLSAPDKSAGRNAKCPKCSAVVVIPTADAQWPQAAEAKNSDQPIVRATAETGWYYPAAGRIIGPLSPDDIRQYAKLDMISRETPVRRGETGPWVRAGSIPDFFGQIYPGSDAGIIRQDLDRSNSVANIGASEPIDFVPAMLSVPSHPAPADPKIKRVSSLTISVVLIGLAALTYCAVQYAADQSDKAFARQVKAESEAIEQELEIGRKAARERIQKNEEEQDRVNALVERHTERVLREFDAKMAKAKAANEKMIAEIDPVLCKIIKAGEAYLEGINRKLAEVETAERLSRGGDLAEREKILDSQITLQVASIKAQGDLEEVRRLHQTWLENAYLFDKQGQPLPQPEREAHARAANTAYTKLLDLTIGSKD
jgi:phage FluMu protein Com